MQKEKEVYFSVHVLQNARSNLIARVYIEQRQRIQRKPTPNLIKSKSKIYDEQHTDTPAATTVADSPDHRA